MKTMVVFKTHKKRNCVKVAIFPCQEIWRSCYDGVRSIKIYWSELDDFGEVLENMPRYRKATDEEAAPGKAALEAQGYTLEVRRRMPTERERLAWIAAGND